MTIEISFNRLYLQDPWMGFWGYLYEEHLPGEFTVNAWGSGSAMFKNLGTSVMTFDATVEFLNPSNGSEGKYTRNLTLSPGWGLAISTENGLLTHFDKAGPWYLRASALGVTQAWHILNISHQATPYTCPYCKEIFESQEELSAHILEWHPEIPPPDGEPPEWEKYLKWGLIGGGIILVSAFVIRPLIRRSK